MMRDDLLGCLCCVLSFASLLLAPGYCLAWLANLLGFRSRPPAERLAWAVSLSFAIAPIAATLVGGYLSLNVVLWLGLLCFAGLAALLLAELHSSHPPRPHWLAISLAIAWVLFVLASLLDIPIGNHLYLSVTVFDHALRTSFVDAVLRTGVPPANPLFWPGHAAPMRYYYFWYVLAAAAARLAGATPRQAIIASAVWAGFGLAAILNLFCSHFLPPSPSGNTRRRWPRFAIALALLAVTGLDILPAIVKALLRMPADGDMEWWSSDQVASWMDSLLWVPHHIASLVCCLFGFLLLWLTRGLTLGQRTLFALLAGLAFASAFGLSTWVAVAFVMVLALWIPWVLVSDGDSRSRLPVLLGAALVAVLALAPYLNQLRSAASNTTLAAGPATTGSIAGSATHLLRFGVRRIIDPDALLALAGNAHSKLVGTAIGVLAELLLLIPGYFVELGFYGLVLALSWRAARRRTLTPPLRTALFLTLAGLVVTTFLRSTVISNNDFGWRSALIPQFFLLLLAVGWCEGAFDPIGPILRRALIAMLAIGVAGTVYQAIGLRLYLPIEEQLGRPDQAGLSERSMALRVAFRAMDGRIPPRAVIQFNPTQPSVFFQSVQVLYARRQIATAFPECASAFGGDASACPPIQRSVALLFTPVAGRALSAAAARAQCTRLDASYLVATRWDGVWFDPHGWVWALPAAVATPAVRVLQCS